MRRSGGGNRGRRPGGDDPPNWPFVLGGGGLLANLLGRAAGGARGETVAEFGCAITALGALAFLRLLIERHYLREKRD